jgi:hypothetical protein
MARRASLFYCAAFAEQKSVSEAQKATACRNVNVTIVAK